MKKIKGLSRKSRIRDSTRHLLETNNNDIQDGCKQACTRYENPVDQNNMNIHKEQHPQREVLTTQEDLAEILGMPAEYRCCCSTLPESKAGQCVCLIQKSVAQHFPKLPADVDQNLCQYLIKVQETVLKELVKLAPLLTRMGLMGRLIEFYHLQTFSHLDTLRQNACSSKNSFLLMNWVLHTYLSPELLGHSELQEMDPIKNVDLLLLTEWVEKAKHKLLENVKKEVKVSLAKILQNERGKKTDKDELYLDTIQYIDAMLKGARQISNTLSDHVQDVCFQELLVFLTKYNAEQTEILQKQAKMDNPEMKAFFKTLINCKELKQYIQSKAINTSLLNKTAALLDHMEAFTLKLLKKVIADMAESHLTKYFKSVNKEFLLLIHDVKSLFSEMSSFQDIRERVMDEAYKLIAHIYLKHLIQSSRSKLRRRWSPDVGQTVAEDAELLQETFSNLAPGVRQWSCMLLGVKELYKCEGIDAVKITVASMQEENQTWSEFLELLPALMRWKGLCKREIMELEDLLEDLPGYQHRPRSVSWLVCFYW